jgi:hypothetical protein
MIALAPRLASADPPPGAPARDDTPRAAVRLEYTLGPGASRCPPDGLLRNEVIRRMGYDPFDSSSAERLTVRLVRKGSGFAAHVDKYAATGDKTWTQVFPGDDDCTLLLVALSSDIGAVLEPVPHPPRPASEPAPTPPEPAPPPPLPAPTPQPAKPPAPPDVPNLARVLPTRVAIVFYALAGAFLGLGIAWSVDAQNKANAASALAAKPYAGGTFACANGQAPSGYCADLRNAVQSQDTAIGVRNSWFVAAGVSAAVGIGATFWTLSLPVTIKGPQAQVSLRPGGLVIQGSF